MFSPRGPATRSQNSPFTPLQQRGTPGKRGFTTPRRGREKRTQNQSVSRSLQVSQLVDEDARYRIEGFGGPLPVLITEALTLADRSTEVTVKVDPNGWAWLVGGRKLFIWRYNSTTTRGIQCKELVLPPSDLAHTARQVCVLGGTGEGQPTACVAVSPEGTVRYWPNIAYEAATSEVSAELKGEECATVVNFQPFGCLLATTTSSLLLLKMTNGQNSITCTALKTSQGMFSGISRRMSSFIFGASPAQAAGAPLQSVVAGEEDGHGSRPFYVLSDAHVQKWHLSSYYPEKLIYQLDAHRLFKDALARRVWDQESISLPQLQVWLLDIQLISDGMIILGAGVNLESSPEMYFATAMLLTDDDQAPNQLDKLTVINHTEKFEVNREEELLSYNLLVPTTMSKEAFIYNQHHILIMDVADSQSTEKLDLQSSSDRLLGTGTCGDVGVFFSLSRYMFRILQNCKVEDSIMDELGQDSLLRSETSTMGFNLSQVLELSQCEDKLSRLKACFICSLTGKQSEVERMLGDLFPPSSREATVGEGGREIDRLVSDLSCHILNDYPTADPRWAEVSKQDGGSSYSVIIVQQLRDKVRALDYFHSFLKKHNLWEQLSVVPVRGGEMCTYQLLCEHVEKLEAAIGLRQQDEELSKIVDVCIRRLLKQRGTLLPPSLNAEDVFFREVSKLQDLAAAFLDYETEILNSGITSRQSIRLIININNLLQTMISTALVYRETKGANYQGQLEVAMPEYVPWTATSGPSGLRTVLSKQIAVTVDRGLAETTDVETRGQLLQQLVSLSDLQLDGYVSQLQSLRPPDHADQHTDHGGERTDRHANRYAQLSNKYQDQRSKLIAPLLECEQYDRAASLAEKYYDFDALIRICDVTDNQDRLQRYVTQFAEQGFSQFLFDWYLKHGKRGRLLSQPFAHNPQLRGFLAADSTRYLSWLHQIGTGDFNAAHETLTELAGGEQTFLSKRKTLLSLSKLAALASDASPETIDYNIGAINEELTQVNLQETLSKEALEKVGLDPSNMRVLSPNELIRLYAGEVNADATERDFKKALDLLPYVDKVEYPEDYEELRLFIWCQALLRDEDRWVDTTEKDPIAIRNETMFFKTVYLLYNEGEDLGALLPSTESLLECESLGELRHNTHFQFLLKAGYEVIANVLLSC